MEALAFVSQLLGALPGLINAGAQVMDLITNTRDQINDMQSQNRGPTQQEWDELNSRIQALRQQLHAP